MEHILREGVGIWEEASEAAVELSNVANKASGSIEKEADALQQLVEETNKRIDKMYKGSAMYSPKRSQVIKNKKYKKQYGSS